MQVVIVLISSGKILRTSDTTSGRYGGRFKHPDKECYGYVGQLAAVGNLPVVELFVEIVKYPIRDIETLFCSTIGRKRVGYRARTIVSIVHTGCRSLNRFRPIALSSIDLSGMPLPVVKLLPDTGKFRNPLIYGIAYLSKCLFVFFWIPCAGKPSICCLQDWSGRTGLPLLPDAKIPENIPQHFVC